MFYIFDKGIYPCGTCGSPGVVIPTETSVKEGVDIGIGDVVCSNRKCKMHFTRNLPISTHYSGKCRTNKKQAIANWNMINTDIPNHHDAFDAMFPGCTPDDLPFLDVVAGLRPATTEASAYAEGESAPASEVLGGDE